MIATLSLQEKVDTLSLLSRIFNNVIQQPNDDKYRKIKLAGKEFSNKVWKYPDSEELMKIGGWVVEGDHIILRVDSQTQVATSIIFRMLQVSD